jgi:hypothetical protein
MDQGLPHVARRGAFSHASHQLVLRDYRTTVDRAEERVAELDKDLA